MESFKTSIVCAVAVFMLVMLFLGVGGLDSIVKVSF